MAAATTTGSPSAGACAFAGHVDALRESLSATCDAHNATTTTNQLTLAEIAVDEGHADVLRELVAAKCDASIDRTDK